VRPRRVPPLRGVASRRGGVDCVEEAGRLRRSPARAPRRGLRPAEPADHHVERRLGRLLAEVGKGDKRLKDGDVAGRAARGALTPA